MLYDVVNCNGFWLRNNDQKVFVGYLIPSMNGHQYPIVKLKKTLISYSPTNGCHSMKI